MYIIGPNASGKSNLLDAFRFLRDVALPAGVKPSGGGLQKAVIDRGGLSKLRSLNARNDTEVLIEVAIYDERQEDLWEYALGFKGEGRANNRIVISKEIIKKNNTVILERPDAEDLADVDRRTQTFLELTNSNQEFRDISHFFSEITYLHLVPQLLKFADQIGGNQISRDPFGQGFLNRVAAVPESTRRARLNRIQSALGMVVPQFKELKFDRDGISGRPHIMARFDHWRPTGAWQREDQFSDGTLRLIGLLWSLMEGSSLLLMEEPELSLNEEIVRKLPSIIERIHRSSRNQRQVLITTHSDALLSDQSIGSESVIRLKPTTNGTVFEKASEEEIIMLKSGMSVGDVLLPGTRPSDIEQFELSFR